MTTTEIREALTEVGHALDVPPVDELAFRARMRRERRRHLAARGAVVGTAAAALVVGAVAAPHLVGAENRSHTPAASAPATPAAAGHVSETVWFVRDDRLTSLDPSGEVHRTDLGSEGVVGYTTERVYAVDRGSHVVVLRREHDHEGLGHDTAYPQEQSPVPGTVQSAVLSGDGRYLASVDLDERVTVRDLKAGRVAFRVQSSSGTYVAGVGPEGVLLAVGTDLVLRSPSGEVAVPTREADDTWGAQLASGRVLVPGLTGGSRIYDLRSGHAQLVTTLPGGGAALAPYAAAAATIEPTPDDTGAVVRLWDGERTHRLRGLDGIPQQVRFADEQTLLVATGGGQEGLWACSVADLDCAALPVPAGQIRLGR